MTTSARRPKFLTVDEVLLLHAVAMEEFGGESGLRDEMLLKSAVAQAESGLASGYLHGFPFEMAAAYGFHLAKNHPFIDGNKRVAWSAVRVFLHKNGYVIRQPCSEEVRVMLAVASGGLDKATFTSWIEQNAIERPRLELREFFATLSIEEFSDAMRAIADSWRSGGTSELTAIVDECSDGIPFVAALKELYVHDKEQFSQVIPYIQTLCAVHRLAESKGYEW